MTNIVSLGKTYNLLNNFALHLVISLLCPHILKKSADATCKSFAAYNIIKFGFKQIIDNFLSADNSHEISSLIVKFAVVMADVSSVLVSSADNLQCCA